MRSLLTRILSVGVLLALAPASPAQDPRPVPASFAVILRQSDGALLLRRMDAELRLLPGQVALGYAANYAHAGGRLAVQWRDAAGEVSLSVFSRELEPLAEPTPTALFRGSTASVAPWLHFDATGQQVLVPGRLMEPARLSHQLNDILLARPYHLPANRDSRLVPATDLIQLPRENATYVAYASGAGVVLTARDSLLTWTPLQEGEPTSVIELGDGTQRVSGQAWLDQERLLVLLSDGTLHTLLCSARERATHVQLAETEGQKAWGLALTGTAEATRLYVGLGPTYEEADRVAIYEPSGRLIEALTAPRGHNTFAVASNGIVVFWNWRTNTVTLAASGRSVILDESPMAVVPLD